MCIARLLLVTKYWPPADTGMGLSAGTFEQTYVEVAFSVIPTLVTRTERGIIHNMLDEPIAFHPQGS